ncbi:uncharacterized protein LOC34618325 [Cyclospora cayetanensis]|uniref:Uncharacterized protein LOC34618325 n=1 Tax=Cyclospora cayetanensis TaxID=88456 RepID=A0A6P5WER1_9EIME|nr:uncharacterized protein LOC34618325 [Cyclospora cayetanensis]
MPSPPKKDQEDKTAILSSDAGNGTGMSSSLEGVSVVGYGGSSILNIRRNDAYTWARLQCWDLVLLLQLGTLCLPSLIAPSDASLPSYTSNYYASIWPLWVLASVHLSWCLLLGLMLLRDSLLQQNTVTRVLVHMSEIHAVAFLLFVVSLSQWLSAHLNTRFVIFVSSGVVCFFLMLLFAAFVSVCFMANHTQATAYDVEQGANSQGAPAGLVSSSAATARAAAAAMGPPLMCDMKLTLERVSEHFYKIRGSPEEPGEVAAVAEQPLPGNAPTESGRTAQERGSKISENASREGSPQGEISLAQGPNPESSETGMHEGVEGLITVPTAAAHADAASQAAVAIGEAEEAPQREAELCIICCNNGAGACRSGLCPTCRCPVKGVVELKGNEANQAQQTTQLEGVVRDVGN